MKIEMKRNDLTGYEIPPESTGPRVRLNTRCVIPMANERRGKPGRSKESMNDEERWSAVEHGEEQDQSSQHSEGWPEWLQLPVP